MPGVSTAPTAYIQYDLGLGSKLPELVTADKDWCVAMWIKPEAEPFNRSIVQLSHHTTPGLSAIHVGTTNSGQDIKVNVYDASGHVIASSSTADTAGGRRPITTAFQGWSLVIVSHDAVNTILSSLSVTAINSFGDVVTSPASTYVPVAASIGPFDRVRIGRASYPASAGMKGEYGPVVIRANASKPEEAEAIWAERCIGGPVAHMGGSWNADTGAIWGIMHAMCSHPWDRDGGESHSGLPTEFSPFSTITPGNCCIFDRGMEKATHLDVHSLRCKVEGTWRWITPDDFFRLGTPKFEGMARPTSVPGEAPTLLALAEARTEGRRRILVTGNSRATRIAYDMRSDVGPWPQSWAAGLALARLDQICGTLTVFPGATAGVADLGMDYSEEIRASYRTTNIPESRAFRRYGVGSTKNADTLENGDIPGGPGAGVLIRPDGYYQTLTKEAPGSRYLWAHNRTYRALVLAYPGSTAATIESRSSAFSLSDVNAVVRGAGTRQTLDTTRKTAAVVAGDLMSRTVTIAGVGHNVRPGEAISTFNSTTTWDVSIIASAEEVGGNTVLTLEHWFDPAIFVGPGRTVRIGAWDFRWLEIQVNASAPWTTEPFQGFRVVCDQTAAGPVCLITEEWFANVDGYLIGAAGWAAHGYAAQLESAFTTIRASDGRSPFKGVLEALDLDCLLMTPAQQELVEDSLGIMTNAYRDALPSTTEIVWLADFIHGRSTLLTNFSWLDQDYSNWFKWMQSHAREYGVAYIAGGFGSLGNFADQYGRGWRSNSCSHATSEGNLVWARAVLADAKRTLPLWVSAPTLPRARQNVVAVPG